VSDTCERDARSQDRRPQKNTMLTEQFGRFRVHDYVGSGGMAMVHRATFDGRLGTRREIALKRMLPQLADDADAIADFVREATLALQLEHPNIVRTFELGQIDETYFIAMELVNGSPLDALMSASRTAGTAVPLGVALSLLVELTDAIAYASTATDDRGEPLRIVHRDISPSNLIVTDGGHLKVIDFGVARTADGRFATSTGRAKGKPGYMAPEVWARDALDARADLYSIGVVAWELLAGTRLFDPQSLWSVREQATCCAIRPPSAFRAGIPPVLDAIVLAAVAASRDERWQSAGELHAALQVVCRTYSELATPLDVARWARSFERPRRFEPTLRQRPCPPRSLIAVSSDLNT
jgi:serine/threonine protein kinase